MASILVIKANAYDPIYATVVLIVVLGVFGLWQSIKALVRAVRKG